MKILVTGAAGFLGSIISREAKTWGHEVLACSRWSGSLLRLEQRRLRWESDPSLLARHLTAFAPNVVFHCAGSASVGKSVEAPHQDFQASVGTWAVVLEAVRLSKLQPVVVFPSSAAVYGNPSQLPVREDCAIAPISPYGWHKALCEHMAQAHAASFGTRIVIARIFSLFGPTQRRLLLWELFQQLAMGAEAVTLSGTGLESRDYLHEDDAAQALIALAQHALARKPGSAPQVVNLAGGTEITVLELAQQLCSMMDVPPNVHCLGRVRAGDPLRWSADVSLLRRLTPSLAAPDFGAALEKTIRVWQSMATPSVPIFATA